MNGSRANGAMRTLTPMVAGGLVCALAIAACGGDKAELRDEETVQAAQSAQPAPAPRLEPPPAPREPLATQKTYAESIDNEDAWLAFSRPMGRDRYGKVLIDLRSGKVFYFDVNTYAGHADFAFRAFYRTGQTEQNRRAFETNYGTEKPDFLLCTIVNHQDADIWSFAFDASDKIKDPKQVIAAFDKISKSFFRGDKLRFRPESKPQERLIRKVKRKVPVITNKKLYDLATTHTYNIGRRVGVLRIVWDARTAEQLTFKPNEIVILPEPIPHITAVAGIISEQFSSPLAHANLRAATWGIPHVGLRKASKRYKKLDGKPVFFEARADGYTLRAATPEEVQLMEQEQREARQVLIPRRDLDAAELKWLTDLRASDAPAYGAKAANLGEVAGAGVDWLNVPPGFGIPIRYYEDHLHANRIDKLIAETLADEAFADDPAIRKRKLAEIRDAITAAPVDATLLAEVMANVGKLLATAGEGGVFVRSSTNAEDLPRFTGAGLYDTVPNVRTEGAIAGAIRTVWASVWNFRAYEERQLYGIDHRQVFGAILVQLGIDARASGVLVNANIYDALDRSTYTINAKSGLGMKVVAGRKLPEQILYDRSSGVIKVLSRSDEETKLVFDPKGGVKEVPIADKGSAVLSDARVYALGLATEQISKLFGDRALDIEWVFTDDALFIVQVRPYVAR